jgi:hypothetical protein
MSATQAATGKALAEEKAKEVDFFGPADFSLGAAADAITHPVMLHFGVPIDNQNTLIRLHSEISRALRASLKASTQPTGEKATKKGKCNFNDAIIYKDPNNKHQYASIMVPKGRSTTTTINLKRTIAAMIEYCIEPKGEDDKEYKNCINQVIGELEKGSEFITVTTETKKIKKMDAHSAAAMWEDAKVSTVQQRKINRHLDAYFGARLTVPESEVRAIGKGDPEVLAAHKKAMEKTTRKRKSHGESSATNNSTEQNLARDT